MTRPEGLWARLKHELSSLQLTLFCLSSLFVLVLVCTFLQVPLGIHMAVDKTIRSFLVWWTPEGATWSVPVFPGGGLLGLLLMVNLLFAQFLRLERSRRKAGLWLAHAGLAFLFVGEFCTAFFQVESQMPIEEGATRDWSEDYRLKELAVTDATGKEFDVTTAVPDSLLRAGARLAHPSLPFTATVRRYHRNATLAMRRPTDPPSEATSGMGAELLVRPEAPSTVDDTPDAAAALVEFAAGDKTLGVFWLSNALGAAQSFVHEGRTWRVALRNRRYDFPFSLTLKDFRHDLYAGTNIPKNFSSLVRLRDVARGEDRDVLISMNNPLRHGGKTFYQASFGRNDTLSVLQVVRNPGWLIPYVSCIMVTLGLLLHFVMKMRASLGKAA